MILYCERPQIFTYLTPPRCLQRCSDLRQTCVACKRYARNALRKPHGPQLKACGLRGCLCGRLRIDDFCDTTGVCAYTRIHTHTHMHSGTHLMLKNFNLQASIYWLFTFVAARLGCAAAAAAAAVSHFP